jgi:hypothetical protein
MRKLVGAMSVGPTPPNPEPITESPVESTPEPTDPPVKPPAPKPTESPSPEPTSSPEEPVGGICTDTPDYECYPNTDGRPWCCPDDCVPGEKYPCETTTPTLYPTDKPTKKPTKKPTRKPTRKPTNSPVSDRSLGVCAPDVTEVNVTRDGSMFRFRWNETYGACVDYDNSTYEYGEYYNVQSYEECVDTCVLDVDVMLTGDMFRGIDYVCEDYQDSLYSFNGNCRCLYDMGTIDSESKKIKAAVDNSNFDNTYYGINGRGTGPVEGEMEAMYEGGPSQITLCGFIFDQNNVDKQFAAVAVY